MCVSVLSFELSMSCFKAYIDMLKKALFDHHKELKIEKIYRIP